MSITNWKKIGETRPISWRKNEPISTSRRGAAVLHQRRYEPADVEGPGDSGHQLAGRHQEEAAGEARREGVLRPDLRPPAAALDEVARPVGLGVDLEQDHRLAVLRLGERRQRHPRQGRQADRLDPRADP
ncbi:hypothetical protein [Methylobacterium indicum]|uniref:hypothetical protein n=1 Tax=Methylobacterium indicum TaxID=1775910 RepID=UPI001A92F04A|nr:hypothetical protein [Methylobacterium indicum]